jgi:hypothetical protein
VEFFSPPARERPSSYLTAHEFLPIRLLSFPRSFVPLFYAMAELYNEHAASYAPRDGPVGHPYPVNNDIPYQSHHANGVLPPSSTSSGNSSSPESASNSPTQTTPKTEIVSPTSQTRQEGKQQATFLTKLYAYVATTSRLANERS